MNDIRVSYTGIPEDDWRRAFGEKKSIPKLRYLCKKCGCKMTYENSIQGCPNGCRAGLKIRAEQIK